MQLKALEKVSKWGHLFFKSNFHPSTPFFTSLVFSSSYQRTNLYQGQFLCVCRCVRRFSLCDGPTVPLCLPFYISIQSLSASSESLVYDEMNERIAGNRWERQREKGWKGGFKVLQNKLKQLVVTERGSACTSVTGTENLINNCVSIYENKKRGEKSLNFDQRI